MLKKNDVHVINIIDIGSKAEGIGRVDNFVVFVDNCLPGDICEVKILKVKKNYAFGKVVRVITASPLRVTPPCPASDKCGGCALMHMNYSEQLKLKEKKVRDSLERLGGFSDPAIFPIEHMESTKAYRNKAQIPVREENSEIKIGYYAKNSHRVVENSGCYIQCDVVEEIVQIVHEYMIGQRIPAYNEAGLSGMIRHIVVKSAFGTGQIMVVLVLNAKPGVLPKNHKLLIEELSQIDGMASICFNYNNESTNVIMGAVDEVIWGQGHIMDKLGKFDIKISPQSFYQVNPVQTLKIYECALDFAEVSDADTVIDAYCGAGTISLFFAQRAKKVYGIEVLSQAIDDANRSAEVNDMTNLEFILGKSEEVIYEFIDKDIAVDIIVVDPPRKGCDIKFLEAAAKLGPKKIVYISCNPDTLARDLKILADDGYDLKAVKPFDMFCHTLHVEAVTVLERK